MDTRSIVSGYVAELAPGHEPVPVGPDQSLIGDGILDSLALLKLLQFLEERFGIEVEDGDVVPANFETIEQIAAFVERKRDVRAGSPS